MEINMKKLTIILSLLFLASISYGELLGLNHKRNTFESYDPYTGTITDRGTTTSHLKYLMSYSNGIFVGISPNETVFEYYFDPTTNLVETITPYFVKEKGNDKVDLNNQLNVYYPGIDLFEGVPSFGHYHDVVEFGGAYWGIGLNAKGVYSNDVFQAGWGENIQGITKLTNIIIIPEPATIGLIALASCLIVIRKKLVV
jgi:hypothetical protein